MILKEKNKILSQLGIILKNLGEKKPWPGYSIGINESEYNELEELVVRVHAHNGWFSPEAVRQAFLGISTWLTDESLENWQLKYKLTQSKPKRVAIIMAGNIPLVGFHDFLAVFVSGNVSIVKMSSEDKHLFPAIINTLSLFDERIFEWVEFAEMPLQKFDAVIATGSNNSARYFESYFGKYPNIIRKNRSSMAVLTGDETKAELAELGKDIFQFYGLGCRNVTFMWIPENFELNRFFEAIYDFNQIVNHNKYANNYDYNKAVHLMNLEQLLDNGFIILKEDQSLHSPLAMLNYARYKDVEDVNSFINSNEDAIQVIVGKQYAPFGTSQTPKISDYADGIDTMEFLVSL